MELVITCDGGFKREGGLPGIAAYACLVWLDFQPVYKESGVVCWGRSADSLVAEYGAVVAALRWLLHASLGPVAQVGICSDCRSVVDRLTGRCTVRRKRGFVMLHRTVGRMVAQLERRGCRVVFWHVPRSLVREADALCRRVYSQRLRRPEALEPKSSCCRLTAFLRLSRAAPQ